LGSRTAASNNGNMSTDFYTEIVASSGAYKWFVDGQWKESTSGKTVPILNPATNQTAFTVQGLPADNP
jgi:glyceraldehyde-3-phosphate dehydrogenase (NADP+)